jgi:RHS repeat-associated protein
VTINYTYDPLYRLTAADYSDGKFYHYAYDSVGNRLTASDQSSVTSYQYDSANRLASVNGVTYTFDANGNLLNDGQNSYAYDSANRLISFNGTGSFSYNGLGDRLTQNGTHYTLDLNAGLTQVLSDGTNTYIYGLGRIAQTGSTTEYFLTDALGSVRQLTDAGGAITLTKAYDPYGVVTQASGAGQSAYGYTGEQQDASGMVFLRARYYSPNDGRFQSRDTWGGDGNRPMSMNRWGYVEGNPINLTDPTGNSVCYEPLPTSCQIGLAYVHGFASTIKGFVESGSLLPVEGFAMLADLSKSQFNGDIRDLLWAMTIVLDDFDANRGPIWQQAPAPWVSIGPATSPYFIRMDWLPYQHNPKYDKQPWCDPTSPNNCFGIKWIHSLRGDWNTKYWDKTANQAYHFWFYVAVTFFDGRGWAELANNIHDGGNVTTYDFSGSLEGQAPPPPNVSSQPDRNLAFQGMDLGETLRTEYDNQAWSDCDWPNTTPSFTSTDLGSWIRSHLK